MDSQQHFNEIAKEYDYWKKKNFYYYDALKELLRSHIPPRSSVLEIGCGTGDLLAATQPSQGHGIDISSEMVHLAQQKYTSRPELSFQAVDITTLREPFPHDYIFLVDVLEHVERLPEFLISLDRITKPSATILITLANPIWEPVLHVAEKLHMKMPEGPHWRLSIKENEKLFKNQGWQIEEKGYRLLVPKKLPGSDWINKKFYQSKLLSRLGFIIFWKLKKLAKSN